jgi:hypothetical protein
VTESFDARRHAVSVVLVEQLGAVATGRLEGDDVLERAVAPTWTVQVDGLLDRELGFVDGRTGELVALHGSGEVLHDQHEVGDLVVVPGHPAGWCSDVHRRGDLGVEPNFTEVGAVLE